MDSPTLHRDLVLAPPADQMMLTGVVAELASRPGGQGRWRSRAISVPARSRSGSPRAPASRFTWKPHARSPGTGRGTGDRRPNALHLPGPGRRGVLGCGPALLRHSSRCCGGPLVLA
ncbi:hypothetical protein QJS66_22895 [Kocuria rhizophila]|nr:hypothetical protein QJS66_22895 [Kocuria rhizophila]